MSHGKHFFKAISGMPLVSIQRASVRYRLRMTEPDDIATRLSYSGADNDSPGEHSIGGNTSFCDARP